MFVIALSGLPGTGKSTLADALAGQLACPVLNKDRVREALFGARFSAFSRAQDDHCCELLYASAAWLAAHASVRCVVIDGRTFLREGQAERLVMFAAEAKWELRFVLCVAPREVALRRIDLDRARGLHPAADRTRELFEALEREARPLAPAHCIVDTHALALHDQVQLVRNWIGI